MQDILMNRLQIQRQVKIQIHYEIQIKIQILAILLLCWLSGEGHLWLLLAAASTPNYFQHDRRGTTNGQRGTPFLWKVLFSYFCEISTLYSQHDRQGATNHFLLWKIFFLSTRQILWNIINIILWNTLFYQYDQRGTTSNHQEIFL